MQLLHMLDLQAVTRQNPTRFDISLQHIHNQTVGLPRYREVLLYTISYAPEFLMMQPPQFRKDLARLLTDPPSSIPPFEPTRENFTSLLNETKHSDKLMRSLFASGMLTFGDLTAVPTILDYKPDVKPGIGTGIMIAAPSLALTIMLPLPDSLQTTHRTVIDQELFNEWFEKYRESLVFDPSTETFAMNPTLDGA